MTRYLCLIFLIRVIHAADCKWPSMPDPSWKWIDKGATLRTRAELDTILHAHEKWLANPKEGKRADLSQTNLNSASLDRANLRAAILVGADLKCSELSSADLRDALLTGASVRGALLTFANLRGAQALYASFEDANLVSADLSSSHFLRSDFRHAALRETNLSGIDLTDSDLTGALYQPKQNPASVSLASVTGLDYLDWYEDSRPILELRQFLIHGGFDRPARRVTAAIRRHGQSSLEWIFFDVTCEWGANWRRPLILIGILSVLCTVIYWIGMHFGAKSGLYLTATGQPVTTAKGKEHAIRIRLGSVPPVHSLDQLELALAPELPRRVYQQPLRRKLAIEVTGLGTAFLFSLMSVFNIGFREFNFGRWIRMLQPRDFDLRARGWMRTVSGLQSLIGVGLTALSLLSYFGHPFD